MTQLDLDAIEARANAATPGPWSRGDTEITADADLIYDDPRWPGQPILREGGPMEIADCYRMERPGEQQENAEFIAHAREDVPALISRIRELEAKYDLETIVNRRRIAELENALRPFAELCHRYAETNEAPPSLRNAARVLGSRP